MWAVRASAAFLSYRSQFHGFHYFRGLLLFDTLNIMFDMWGRWTWQDGVWKENLWAGFLVVCAAMGQPGCRAVGSSGLPDRKVQAQEPGYNKASWVFQSNICWEWTKFLLRFSLSRKGSILRSLCLNSFSLYFVIPLGPVPHPLFFFQYCVA